MGCGSSSLNVNIPGLSSIPAVEYAETRRKASSALLKAHNSLLDSTSSYSEALEDLGRSLKTLSNSIVIFDSPARYPPPPRTQKTQHQSPVGAPTANGGSAELHGEDSADESRHKAGGANGKEEVGEEGEAASQQFPLPGVGMELRHKLEDIVGKMESLLEKMAEVHNSPVEGPWAAALEERKRKGPPPLSAAASRSADGSPEPIGSTLQRLEMWERHFKGEVEALEAAKFELGRSDKVLTRQATRVGSNPSANLEKLNKAQGKKSVAAARLESRTQTMVAQFKEMEVYKTHVLFPQIIRLFPDMSETWRESEGLFRQLEAAAGEMAALDLVIAGEYKFHEAPEDITSEAGVIPGAATRPYHNATKGLEESLHKWGKASKALNKSQEKYSNALLGWIQATMSVPGEFPKPTEEELRKLYRGEEGNSGTEVSFGAMTVDWKEAVNVVPEKELEEAIGSVREALKEAKELQIGQVQQMKAIEKARKDLRKIETRYEKAERMEFELKKAIEEIKDDEEKAMELEARERQLDKTTMEVQVCLKGVQQSRGKFLKERKDYTHLIVDECNAAGTALGLKLPELLRVAREYCQASAKAYKDLHAKHERATQNGA